MHLKALLISMVFALTCVLSLGAQTPADNGNFGPASGAAPNAIVTGGQWYEILWNGVEWCTNYNPCGAGVADPGFIPWIFIVPAGQTMILTVADGFMSGDAFTVYDNGSPIGSTPAVAQGANLGCDPAGSAASPLFSHGTFPLGPGSHSITIYASTSLQGGGAGFFRLDVTGAAAIPALSTWGLVLLALVIGAAGFLALRRTKSA